MVDTSDFERLRFSAWILVFGTAEILEALTSGSRGLCEHAQDVTYDRNKELCEYLGGFLFSVESDSHEGHLASDEWMLQLQSLFDRIKAHVVRSESKGRLGAVWCD